MADIESNINLNIDAAGALATLKELQRQISVFQTTMAKTGGISSSRLSEMQRNLVNNINSTGQFTASIQKVKTTTESFTQALEKNKLSMGQYFRYSLGATKTFGKGFKTEFDTIEKVARERVKTLQTQYIKLGRDANGAMQAIAVRPQVLDMKDLGTQTAIAAQKAQVFNQLMSQGSTQLLNFGKNTQWAGRQLMVGFTIPLGIMGAAAAREFQKIEEQVIRLERVYGDFTTTMADTEQITQQIKDLGDEFTKYGVAVSKTIGLAADAAAMGKTGADLVAQVAEANRLAVLGGVDQQQSLETTISLTNSFGIAAEELSGKINFLNAVENQTVTSIEDLTEAIPKAGPVVQQLGGNVEDLTFFLTAMKEGGINASEGANALKSGLASLINPTGEAAEMLAGFGINLQGIVAANKGNVRGIVVEFAKALDQLDPLNRAQAIEQLFGKFQFSRLSTLFQNVIAEGSQASRVLDLTQASAAELAALSEKELGRIEASPLFKYQAAIEQFRAAIAPVGEEFMKAVTPLINFGTQILEGFNSWSDGAKQFAVIAVGAVGAIGPVLLMTFGLLANGLANIVKGFLFVRNGFKGLGQQSNVLTEQLNYMNTEQMQAATVGASLNQVHNSLIQTFTSEAGAVRNLAAAYGSAISAQGAFMGPITTRGGGMKKAKFATGGIFRGPGTGTSDSIPAMVSNGEAIIPAKNVKKYPGMVAGLIAGNIPGFVDGTMSVGDAKKAAGLYKAPSAIADQTSKMTWDSLKKEQEAIIKALSENSKVSQTQIAQLLRIQASHVNPDVSSVDVNGKMVDVKNWKAKNLQADLGAINNYMNSLGANSKILKEFESVHIDKAAKQLGMSIEDVQKELDLFKKGIHPSTRNAGKVFGAVAATDPNYQGVAASAAMSARLEGNYYETVGSRSYDPKRDAAAKKQTSQRVEKLRQLTNANLVVQEANVTEERQTAAYQKSRIKAEKRFAEQYAKVSGPERAKLTKNKEAWLKQETENIEAQRKETNREKARIRREQSAQQNAPKQTLRSRVGGVASRIGGAMSPGRLGMAGLVAGGALSSMSGMGGPVGDISGQLAGPLMAISGVASVLSMIPGPAGLVIAGLAGITTAVIALKTTFDDAQRKAEEFAYATGASTEAIRSFSAVSGKQSAGEIMDTRRKALGIEDKNANGEPTFGEQFLGSESGKKLQDTISEAFKRGASSQDVVSNISQQMATAVASGVIDAAEAGSIIDTIGAELKDTTFSIKARGELESLIGPNGQDLTKDPITIRVKLVQEAERNVSTSAADVSKTSATGPLSLGNRTADILAMTGSAAVAGGAIGAAIGSPFAGVGAIPGAAIGATVGAIAGATAGTVQLINYWQNLGTTTATFASNLVISTQQVQEMLDSLELQYEERIALAKAAGDEAKAAKLTKEYEEGRAKLLQQNAQLYQSAADQYEGMAPDAKTATIGSLDTQIKQRYEGTMMQAQADTAISKIGAIGGTAELTLKTVVASGDFDPITMSNFIDLLTSQGEEASIIANIITKVGAEDAARIAQLTSLTSAEKGAELAVKFNAMGAEEVTQTLDIIDKVQSYGGNVKTVLDIVASGNGEDLENFTAKLENTYSAIDTVFADGQIEQKEYQAIFDALGVEDFLTNDAYFQSLPEEQKRRYIQEYVTVFATATDAQVSDWYAKKNGLSGAGMLRREESGRLPTVAEMRQQYAQEAGQNAISTYNNAPPPTTPAPFRSGGGGGGGSTEQEPQKPPTSFLDDLVKKMRDVQKASQKLTENFADSWAAISSMVGGTTNTFNGLQQQMRRLGAGEDLISLVAGMSPEEYEARKNDLFNFDANGNITSFKNMLGAIGKTMRSIALGEFQNKQASVVQTTKDQFTAVQKLVAAGASYAEAYEIVADTATASAIANEDNAASIRTVAEASRDAAEAANALSAAQSLVASSKKNKDMKDLVRYLSTYSGNISESQMSAILNDENLQSAMLAMFKGGTFDATAISQALTDAANQAQLDLSVKKLTIPGMEEIFSDGMNKALEQVSLKEAKIKLKFEEDTAADQKTIKKAQEEINDIRNREGGIDDLEADLQRIADKEKLVNEKYDERYKALDKIDAANARIANREQAQLSIAQALSSGDIGAAAAAMQQLQADEAAAALADRRAALQKAQELELSQLTNSAGLTREQIEEKIVELKKQIFNIEENTLEPAQQRVELAQRQLDAELELQDAIRKSWEARRAEIDAAKTSAKAYTDAIKEAINIQAGLTGAYTAGEGNGTGLVGQFTTTTTTTTTKAPTTPAPTAAPVRTVDYADMARRVYRGEYGNGQDRINRLRAAGFSDSEITEIQKTVNRVYYGYAKGGMVRNYLAKGGFPLMKPMGTDTVPAMLTPGEFVVRKYAVQKFGADNLKAINNGSYNGGSVYNNTYSINVNVKSDANANDIARSVMAQIKQVDAQRIRGNRF